MQKDIQNLNLQEIQYTYAATILVGLGIDFFSLHLYTALRILKE